MSKPIKEIEGIGPANAQKLATAGIHTVDDLLNKGCTRQGRENLATRTGLTTNQILEWVNMADLFRVKGIGAEYSDLLEEAGVDTVVELSKRKPETLHAKLTEINRQKQLVRQVPPLDIVKKWIESAKTLPRKVEY